MLVGYWSNEKIASVAQKNFDAVIGDKTIETWLQGFYQKRAEELARQLPEYYAQMNSSQKELKIQEDIISKMNTFPKRTKPFPDAMTNYTEYEQLKIKENPENIAILALLAKGVSSQSTNK